MKKQKILFCAINNLLSGSCDQDCSFCTQSSKYKTKIKRYNFKKINLVLKEAKAAKSAGACGYCLVTSGKELDQKRLEYILEVAWEIKKELPNLRLIACCGLATKEALKELKKVGISSYNHNLETSQKYYKKICTTHTWEERFKTCENVKEVGLKLCCGGIFGMGETLEDQEELIKEVLSLDPDSIPINFYLPNPALPIKTRSIDKNRALEIIKNFKKRVKKETILMVAAGREVLFGENQKEIFEAGANSIVIGNYLTTKGFDPDYDKKIIKNLGYEVAVGCDGRA